MDDPSTWAIIWLTIAAVLGAGEILLVGSFFLLPFATGALAASLLSLLELHPGISMIVFLLTSFLSFLSMRPLAKKLDKTPGAKGIGANRMIDAQGIVLEPIPAKPGNAGLIKIGSEEWRAESADGVDIGTGSTVTVQSLRATRLIVK